MTRFYILCKRLHLKRKGLSQARAVSITKTNMVSQNIFCKYLESLWSQYLMNDEM